MLIGIDGQTLESPDANRGIGVYLSGLLQALERYGRHRYCLLRWGNVQSARGFPSERLAAVEGRTVGCTLSQRRSAAARGWMRSHHADILFNPNPLQPAVEALSRPGLWPYVATVHDLTPLALGEQVFGVGGTSAMLAYRRRVEQLRTNADFLVCDSAATAAECREHLGFADDRLFVVHLAPGELFKPVEADTCSRSLAALGLDPCRPFLLSVGGFNAKKNFSHVVDAVTALRSSGLKDVDLVVAGPISPEEQRTIVSGIKRATLQSGIRFLGRVSDEALASLYTAAAALVFPSLHEGFGLPILEAMACGCPVVTSNISSMPEVAGDAALLCDPASVESISEAIASVLNTDSLRDKLRQAGFARASAFTWEKTAADMERVFDAVSARANGAAPRISSERLKIAWVSPFPPLQGGVAKYSENLAPALGRRFEVNCVTPADLENSALDSRAYDFTFYNMGNNTAQFAAIYETMKTAPGVTILHDLNIHGFLLDHLVRNPSHPASTGVHPYLTELCLAHGKVGEEVARGVLEAGALPDIPALPCHRIITSRSQAVIVHSAWALKQLECNGDPAPLFRLPQWLELPEVPAPARVNEVRASLQVAPDELLIVTAGYLEPSRRTDVILLALRVARDRGARLRLMTVGSMNPSHQEYLERLASELGIDAAVSMAGYATSDSDFLSYLAAADVVVHLRHPTNGESSSTVLRALALERPVIVSRCDSYAELPDECCWKVDPGRHEVELLARYFLALSGDPGLRQEMGRIGKRMVMEQHSTDAVVSRLSVIIDCLVQQRSWRNSSAGIATN